MASRKKNGEESGPKAAVANERPRPVCEDERRIKEIGNKRVDGGEGGVNEEGTVREAMRREQSTG